MQVRKMVSCALRMVENVKRGRTALFSPKTHRASKSRRNVLFFAKAVASVMRNELGDAALGRWQQMLDRELGEPLFSNVLRRKSSRSPKHDSGITGSGTVAVTGANEHAHLSHATPHATTRGLAVSYA